MQRKSNYFVETRAAPTCAGSMLIVLATSSNEVNEMIKQLDSSFMKLKSGIRDNLEKEKIFVKKVADTLTSLLPDCDKYHMRFLEKHVKELFGSADNYELFGHMNFHWNYLDPSLLDHLVIRLGLKEVEGEMEKYKSMLQEFRMKTPLYLFCRAQKRKGYEFFPDFDEVAASFEWPKEEEVTLEHVELFRQEYASHYKVLDFAMMLFDVRPGSILIIWMVPKSITNILRQNVPIEILKKYYVTELTIAGATIYQCSPENEVCNMSCFYTSNYLFSTVAPFCRRCKMMSHLTMIQHLRS